MSFPRSYVALTAAGLLVGVAACGPHSTTAPPVSASSIGASTAPATTNASPTSSASPSASPVPTLLVAGHVLAAAGIDDVASALRAADVTVADGRLLSVVSGRVLRSHITPGHVDVNGRTATMTTPVQAGDVVTLVAGPDRVESTHRVQVAVRLQAAAAALYTRVTPGQGIATVGAVSGEQVGVDVVRAPTVGALRDAARLAITIDDGPSSGYTEQVLSVLVNAHAPAVFCLIGSHAQQYPALVKQELADGAQLCDHTQNHPLNLPQLPPSRIEAEIRDGYTSIKNASGGVAPGFFRAPGGNWSTRIDDDARALHLVPLHWTVDPRDWSRPGTQAIVLTVLNQLRPNGIVLVHDGGGDRSETVAALRTLLPELRAAGWRFSLPTWVR